MYLTRGFSSILVPRSEALFKVSKPEMVNKIYLYDDKMTVLYNTQDSHSDVTIDDLSSSRVVLVEMEGVEPSSESALTGTSPGAAGFFGTLYAPVPFRTGKPASLSVR